MWGVSPDGHDIARWEDTGSGTLLATGTMSSDAGAEMGPLHSLAATSDELLVRFEDGLVQYRWTAESSPSLSITGQSATPPYYPPPELYGLEMTWEPPLIAMADNGSRSTMCVHTLDMGKAVVAGRCLEGVYAKTADGYWTRSSTSPQPLDEISVHAMQADGTFRRLGTFPVPAAYQGSSSSPWLMIESFDPDRLGKVVLLPRVQPGAPVFEAHAMGNTPAGVERDYFWWHLSDGGTEVVFR